MNRNLEILFTLKLDCITIKYIHVTSEMVQRERERERERAVKIIQEISFQVGEINLIKKNIKKS